MGCLHDSYELISPSEEPFTAEETLGYDFVSLDKLIAALRKANNNYEIALPRLKVAFQESGLNIKYVEDLETSQGKFYQKFLSGNKDKYVTQKLILLAILLCPESSDRKGEHIFHNFDTNDSQTLSQSEVSEILKIMLEIALDDLPTYIYDLNVEKNTAEAELVEKYHRRLLRNKDWTNAELLSAMGRDTLTRGEFINALKTTKLKAICSARSLRTFASNPKPKEEEEGKQDS